MAPADPKEKKVLIVDDDANIVHLLSHVVSGDGFQIATASDGEEALQAIETVRPDAVILDMMMPKYGGFEVLKRLQGGPYAKVPILVVTAHHADPSTEEMIRQESNVVGFMKKPVNLQELLRSLHRILQTAPKQG